MTSLFDDVSLLGALSFLTPFRLTGASFRFFDGPFKVDEDLQDDTLGSTHLRCLGYPFPIGFTVCICHP